MGNGRAVAVEVVNDILARRQHGIQKYKTELKTDNGRDALVDAYQEGLDLVMYLKQRLMEQESEEFILSTREVCVILIALMKWHYELLNIQTGPSDDRALTHEMLGVPTNKHELRSIFERLCETYCIGAGDIHGASLDRSGPQLSTPITAGTSTPCG